ncbi:MAG: hypothetical protein KDK70_00785 [Myxococcales bacterium]|nr:hypothetical protein [Myxococcales bacterium]
MTTCDGNCGYAVHGFTYSYPEHPASLHHLVLELHAPSPSLLWVAACFTVNGEVQLEMFEILAIEGTQAYLYTLPSIPQNSTIMPVSACVMSSEHPKVVARWDAPPPSAICAAE